MHLHYKCFTTTLVTACFFPSGTLLKKAEDIGVSCMWLVGMWSCYGEKKGYPGISVFECSLLGWKANPRGVVACGNEGK